MGKKPKSQVIPRVGERGAGASGRAAQTGAARRGPGGTCWAYITGLHAAASVWGGDRAGAGVTGGFISIYKICFLSPTDCTWAFIIFCQVLFSFMFIFEREGETEHEQGRGRERETKNPKQDRGTELSAQSPTGA